MSQKMIKQEFRLAVLKQEGILHSVTKSDKLNPVVCDRWPVFNYQTPGRGLLLQIINQAVVVIALPTLGA